MPPTAHLHKDSDVLLAALTYARAGYPVFPVRSDKVPHIKGWRENATKDEATIRRWFEKWRTAMIGMPCGEQSGLIVIDCDAYKPNCSESLSEFEEEFGVLPGTVCALSPHGGFHWYYRSPKHLIGGGPNKLGNAIDVQGDGQFVVLPPSIHESGGYKWAPGLALIGGVETAELPKKLTERLRKEEIKKDKVREEFQKGLPRKEDLHYLGELPSRVRGSALRVAPARLFSPLNAAEMKWWLSNRNAVEQLADVIAPIRAGLDSFHCVIPGHVEQHPSGGIAPGKNGVHVYHCRHGRSALFHGEDPRRVFLLGDIFAFRHVGSEFEMNPSERWIWSIRLLVEAKVIEPGDTSDFVPLPENAPARAKTAWEGFRQLLACRRLYSSELMAPLSRRFLSRWCQELSEHHARTAIDWLTKHGFLISFGEVKLAPLYQPADGAGRILSFNSWFADLPYEVNEERFVLELVSDAA